MKLHRALAVACLSLSQCALEPMPTTPAITPVALAATRRPDQDDARTWRGAAMHVLTSGAVRQLVVATGLPDEAGEGFIAFDHTVDPLVTQRAAALAHVPAAWRTPREVVLHGPDGERCTVTASAVTVLSRFSSNDRHDGYWEGFIDEDRGVRVRDEGLRNEAWERGSGGRLLVAALPQEGCAGAEWASLPGGEVMPYASSAADPSLHARALAAMRATPRWAELQATLRESPTEDGAPWPATTLWDSLRSPPALRVWRSATGGRTFVSAHASVPFEGCGVFSGELWMFWELIDGALVQRTAPDTRAEGELLRAVDTDGDGAPELFIGSELLWLGPSGYEPVRSVRFPHHGCMC